MCTHNIIKAVFFGLGVETAMGLQSLSCGAGQLKGMKKVEDHWTRYRYHQVDSLHQVKGVI